MSSMPQEIGRVRSEIGIITVAVTASRVVIAFDGGGDEAHMTPTGATALSGVLLRAAVTLSPQRLPAPDGVDPDVLDLVSRIESRLRRRRWWWALLDRRR